MKEITWLHISDLHSCPEKSSWDADFILNKFLRDIKKLKNEHNLSPDLIFVTGDLIYGNKSECGELKSQHESAALFLLSLIEECNVEIENLFLVPGNHDVDIKKILGSQTKWLKDINIQEIHKMIQTNNDEWQSITKRLANYRNFINKELEAKHLLSNSDQMIFSEQRSINEIKIGIAGLNTAWSSCGDGEKEKGNLWCGGEWQIKTLLKNLNNSDIKIGLSHHPFNWFYATEDPKILHTMQTNFHFHLHGHEHQGWVEPLEDSHHCRIAAGAIFVGHNKTNQSSYNFVRLDFEKQQCEIWFRGYDDTGDGGWVTKEIPGKTDSRGVKVISAWYWENANH